MKINIRGTSGSGKTTLVRYFFTLCTEIKTIRVDGVKKPKGYECLYKGQKVFVVGSYESVCGGCDTVSTQDEICGLIEDFSFDGHVLFEGLFISHIYGRYREMAKEDPNDFVFFMLETPFDTCMEHIKKRREESGKPTELKPSVYSNARKTFDSTYRIRVKLTDDGLTWEELPLENRNQNFQDLLDFYLGV